jgi:3D (Asp-Asp-Asp) domain-containing protein
MHPKTPCPRRLFGFARSTLLAGATALLALGGCAVEPDGSEAVGASHDELRVTSSFTSRGTGYYPSSSALEGGFVDRAGKRLHTLQQFLAGDADYVSVAMDSSAFAYGTRLRIKELEAEHGRAIVFRVVDTGSAFRGKGRSRIDVCVGSRSASLNPTLNGTLHIDVLDEKSGPAPAPAAPPSPDGSGQPDTSDPGAGSGRACTSDGTCNPGSDGAGEICTAGRCVAGCRTSAQCPGSTSCMSGQCR